MSDEERIDTETMTLMILFMGQRLVILHVFHLVWYIQPKGTKHTINKVSNFFFYAQLQNKQKGQILSLCLFLLKEEKRRNIYVTECIVYMFQAMTL